eukprot:1261540-Amorphochlora_amoeboformis.AAC.2
MKVSQRDIHISKSCYNRHHASLRDPQGFLELLEYPIEDNAFPGGCRSAPPGRSRDVKTFDGFSQVQNVAIPGNDTSTVKYLGVYNASEECVEV